MVWSSSPTQVTNPLGPWLEEPSPHNLVYMEVFLRKKSPRWMDVPKTKLMIGEKLLKHWEKRWICQYCQYSLLDSLKKTVDTFRYIICIIIYIYIIFIDRPPENTSRWMETYQLTQQSGIGCTCLKENMIFLLNQYHSLTWLCLTLTNNKLNLRSLSPLLQNVPTLPVCSWFHLGISHPPKKRAPAFQFAGKIPPPYRVSLTFIPRLPNWPFELQKAIFVVKSKLEVFGRLGMQKHAKNSRTPYTPENQRMSLIICYRGHFKRNELSLHHYF